MLNELKQEMAKQTGELTTKAMELKTLESEKAAIEKEIHDKEKERDEAKRKIEAELLQLRNKIPEVERNHRRTAEELTKIRLQQNKNNLDLLRLQRESQSALKEMGKK